MARWGRRRWQIGWSGFGGMRTRPKPAKFRQAGTRKPRGKRRKLWWIVLLITALLGFQFFIFMERNLRPPLMNIAQLRIKQVATQAINKAISEQVAGRSDIEGLIDWKMTENGKVSGFMINYSEHMRITSETINTVQSTLQEVKNMPERIPVGRALGSAILSSFGPRVPVRFEPIGAVKVDLHTRQENVGINNILVEVYIRIATEVAIIIPFDTKPEIVQTEIPISYLLVVGDVPMYYYDNKGNPVGNSAAGAPNIAIPMGRLEERRSGLIEGGALSPSPDVTYGTGERP
ncbi:sporulation protein YunB [Paenibacillus sp. 1P07SE]|uniref:sporulation protein YunB n=1 Tax=Paenibacillus sp. 1P07SE TaxID=3132209 RepID=UPI0039A65441